MASRRPQTTRPRSAAPPRRRASPAPPSGPGRLTTSGQVAPGTKPVIPGVILAVTNHRPAPTGCVDDLHSPAACRLPGAYENPKVRAIREVISEQGSPASMHVSNAHLLAAQNATAHRPGRMRPGTGQGSSASITPLFSPGPSGGTRGGRRDGDERLCSLVAGCVVLRGLGEPTDPKVDESGRKVPRPRRPARLPGPLVRHASAPRPGRGSRAFPGPQLSAGAPWLPSGAPRLQGRGSPRRSVRPARPSPPVARAHSPSSAAWPAGGSADGPVPRPVSAPSWRPAQQGSALPSSKGRPDELGLVPKTPQCGFGTAIEPVVCHHTGTGQATVEAVGAWASGIAMPPQRRPEGGCPGPSCNRPTALAGQPTRWSTLAAAAPSTTRSMRGHRDHCALFADRSLTSAPVASGDADCQPRWRSATPRPRRASVARSTASRPAAVE